MELKEATIRTPTIKDVEDLVSRLDGLVYLQFSESGAMGRPGEVVLSWHSFLFSRKLRNLPDYWTLTSTTAWRTASTWMVKGFPSNSLD
jgi:hypothetical protein